MAVIGGQVQYLLPDATCELYWLNYDSDERKEGESWIAYCNRAASECILGFSKVIERPIHAEAVEAFGSHLLSDGTSNDLSAYQIFILYFDDSETDFNI